MPIPRWSGPWVLRQEVHDASPGSPRRRVTLFLNRRLPPLALGGLVLLMGLLPSRVWLVVLVTLALLLLLAYRWSLALSRGLWMERHLRSTWVQVGDALEERLALVNTTSFPALWVEVRDFSTLPGYTISSARAADAGVVTRWRSEGVCRRRGEFTLGPWELWTGDPFGLFTVRQVYDQALTLLVYPPITSLPPVVLPRGGTVGQAHTSRRAWEPTVNARSVRPYTPGDPMRHIHWPQTAHRGDLLVREFDQETTGDVWLLLDLHRAVQAGHDEEATAEYAIILVASLAAHLLDQGRAVGLWTYGPHRRVVRPARGRGHLWAILAALAPLDLSPVPLAALLDEVGRGRPSGMTALIVTPDVGGDWLLPLARLRRRGMGAAAWLLDPASFGGDGEAEPLRGLLADQGIVSQVIRRGDLAEPRPVLGPRRRWAFKVLGTGRVITLRRPAMVGE